MMRMLLSGLLGLTVGVIAGMYLQQFASSAQGRKLRSDIDESMKDGIKYAERMMQQGREKAVEAGRQVVDKVSKDAHDVDNRAERAKSFIDEVVAK